MADRRPHTPIRRNPDGTSTIRVQRACNGCGRGLGDVNDAELDAAITGRPLPDVRNECGCLTPPTWRQYRDALHLVDELVRLAERQRDEWDAAHLDERPQSRRLITTPRERDALPPETVVYDIGDRTIACRHHSGVGVVFGDDRPFRWDVLQPPLIVLWEAGEDLAYDAAAGIDRGDHHG